MNNDIKPPFYVVIEQIMPIMFILALVFNELYKQVIKASNNMALKLIAFKIGKGVGFYEHINSLGAC